MKQLYAGFLLALVLLPLPARSAGLRLAGVLGDHMVLQRHTYANVWGWAAPDERIRVTTSWNGFTYTARAGSDGRWICQVETGEEGGPHEITVEADTLIVLKDILLGEVWICSGQSNMAWTLAQAQSAPAEIPQADFSGIRFFTVKWHTAARPLENVNGRWQVCSPETAGGFSAVGYFFGKHLYRELGIPVGLVHTSWGGTPCEAWTSKQTLQALKEFDRELRQLCMESGREMEMAGRSRDSIEALIREQMDFMNPDNMGFREKWMQPSHNDSAWQEIPCPAEWSTVPGVGMLKGVAWVRNRFEIPPAWTGSPLVLELGPVDEMDATYLNGRKIGSSTAIRNWDKDRIYRVPASLVIGTEFVLAIRIVNTLAEGGLFGDPEQVKIYPEGAPDEDPLYLGGTWKFRKAYEFPELPLMANPKFPTVLYNAMLYPLKDVSIRGAIWYQGEANVSRAYQYREIFPAMIRDWRATWGTGDFPFYYVQLAPFRYGTEYSGAELREAQLLTLKRVPRTGMAVTLDIGNPDDIHPRNKRDVGRRLALWALADTYGREQLVFSGPLYRDHLIEGDRIRVCFDHTGSGLKAQGGSLTDFEIAGADGVYLPAVAEIDGETVLVAHPKVTNPVAVRYGWSNAAEPNLFNEEGLPASSFRTDRWTRVTEGRH